MHRNGLVVGFCASQTQFLKRGCASAEDFRKCNGGRR